MTIKPEKLQELDKSYEGLANVYILLTGLWRYHQFKGTEDNLLLSKGYRQILIDLNGMGLTYYFLNSDTRESHKFYFLFDYLTQGYKPLWSWDNYMLVGYFVEKIDYVVASQKYKANSFLHNLIELTKTEWSPIEYSQYYNYSLNILNTLS